MNENNLTVTIRDMMECREVRAFLQKQYIDEYAAPVISFCMNDFKCFIQIAKVVVVKRSV